MRLPKHPFPVQTRFRDCHLVNFAIDPSVLARALPSPLVPDSDCDSRLMSALGNGMSFFAFHHADIEMQQSGDLQSVEVRTRDHAADIQARFRPSTDLPATSAFPDLATAKRQLVELFDAYHPRPGRPVTDVVSIRRNDWELGLVEDDIATYQFMDGSAWFPAGSAVLDSAFAVKDLTYRWNRLAHVPSARTHREST